MALLWIEGFEGFGTVTGSAPSPINVLARKYTVIQEDDIDIEAGRLGGYCIRLNNETTITVQSPVLTTDDTLIVGFATKFGDTGGSTRLLIGFFDDSTSGINLRVTPTGELAVYLYTSLLATTSGLGLLADTWYYIELKVVCADSPNGAYEVRVGGVNVLSNNACDTKYGTHNYHNNFKFYNLYYAFSPYIDDLYCLDSTGAVNNDFLGNMRVVAIRPDGDTAANAWTRSGGSENYDLVNEAPCDDDTSYVESAVSTTKDLYTYDAVSGLGDSVKGIQINTVCRETDANSFSLVTVAKLGATESNSAASVVGTTSYTFKTRLMETDPDGNAWTLANVNASEFGIKVN